MKKVMIIGASGFVGSAILNEALNRGYQVTAVVRDPEKIKVKNDNLQVVKANVMNFNELEEAMKGFDAVISAFNPGWSNPNIYNETLKAYPTIINVAKKVGVKRLLIVGGAGSLLVTPDRRVMDEPDVPPQLLPGIKALAEVYYTYLRPEHDIDWVFFSPAANLTPGKRTGKFRLGSDYLVVDEKGDSNISVEDYAAAMINELEKPQHHKERFTVGY